jgi:hypothetical protein
VGVATRLGATRCKKLFCSTPPVNDVIRQLHHGTGKWSAIARITCPFVNDHQSAFPLTMEPIHQLSLRN